MSAVPAADPALRLAIAFINTVSSHDAPQPAPDALTVARLPEIARDHGLPHLANRLALLGDEEITTLRRVRDGLYPVFAAPGEIAKIQALNAVLAREDVHPRVTTDLTKGVRLTAAPSSSTPSITSEVTALVIDAIAFAITVGGPERFGTCAASPCRCVFVDRTRAGRQRFCSQLCNDRMAAAAYRGRKSLAAPLTRNGVRGPQRLI